LGEHAGPASTASRPNASPRLRFRPRALPRARRERPAPPQVRAGANGARRAEHAEHADHGRWRPPRESRGAPRGRDAERPRDIPARGWTDVAWRVYGAINEDRILLVAGGVTFYLLLAIFPALAAFVSLYGLFADPQAITGHVAALEGVVPDEGLALIQNQLAELAGQQGGALTFGFLVSFAIAFWSAQNGVKAIIEGLNIAYNEAEKRSFVKLTLVAFAFTMGAMLIAILMLFAVAVLPAVMAFVELGGVGDLVLRLARWPILLVVIALGLTVLYRFGPSREPPKWRWVTWGSGIATLVWILGSIAFTIYLENFADYNATYGSLGALVGFLLWIWISVIIVLVGAELNGELEHQTRRDSTTGDPLPMGERGAVQSDTLGETRD
jgi:membrane protein